ncbi:MAG: hypothetical protein VB091_10580 [Christensenella sp.]|nr:hypothetical protein [Christensenella sp.]
MKQTKTCLIPVAVLLVLLCGAVAFSNLFQQERLLAGAIALGVSALLLFICRAVEIRWAKAQKRQNDNIFSENSELAKHLVNQVAVPCALVEQGGTIVWRN